MDPYHHRAAIGAAEIGGPDAEVETIFAGGQRSLRQCMTAYPRRDAGVILGSVERLRADGREFLCFPNPAPRRDRCWRFPAELADRRRGEGDSLEHRVGRSSVVIGAFDYTSINNRSCRARFA